jgi:hypothetical protein
MDKLEFMPKLTKREMVAKNLASLKHKGQVKCTFYESDGGNPEVIWLDVVGDNRVAYKGRFYYVCKNVKGLLFRIDSNRPVSSFDEILNGNKSEV